MTVNIAAWSDCIRDCMYVVKNIYFIAIQIEIVSLNQAERWRRQIWNSKRMTHRQTIQDIKSLKCVGLIQE